MTVATLRSTERPSPADDASRVLRALGVDLPDGGDDLAARSPIDGGVIAHLAPSTADEVDGAVARAVDAFVAWRRVPGPRRGELVRRFGDEVRRHKDDLGLLVTLETGKILSEGHGEVQEVIDICDLAVGLSRQLDGKTMPSERPGHRLTETWQPLGPIGVITAFNFPAAVWAWNTAIALVCGDPVVWKPSDKAPLTALALGGLLQRVADGFDDAPTGLTETVLGGTAPAEALVDDTRLPLISATGSTAMGAIVGPRVAARFGRTLLELGGNNAAIVTPSADLEMVRRAVTFAAVGTAGQRCTTLRRLIVHRRVHDEVVDRLRTAYASLPIGDPRDPATLVGPLIDGAAAERMAAALDEVRTAGADVSGGRPVAGAEQPEAHYVEPAIAVVADQVPVVLRETFAPILYVVPYDDLDEAIAMNNAAAHGLSSAIFTTDLREAERFTGPEGSDCGIANVNTGPSGAEIGGAFGGEKHTGGGREAGSDSWRAHMRRSTATVNYSSDLPLAQGVDFG